MNGVSIIVCTYNDSHFLNTALPSCFKQDIENEIILVDDASSQELDAGVKCLLQQFSIKYIKHDVNKGLSAARNTGIAAAKYDQIIVLDADDFFYPNAIVKLAANMTDDLDVVCGYCTDSGNTYRPGIFHEPLSKELFIKDNPVICSSLFKKSIWEKVNGYMVRKGAHYEDWNFWARCFAAGGKFKAINELIYNHASRPNSMLQQLHPNRDFYRKVAVEGVFNE